MLHDPTGQGQPAPNRAAAAWREPTGGERRWPVSIAIAVAIGLQVALPERLGLRPGWLLPALEAVVLVALTGSNPYRIDKPTVSSAQRRRRS